MAHPVRSVRSLHLEALADIGTTAHHPRNSVIFRQAEAADSIYYVEDGLIRLEVSSPHGKRAMIGLCARDTFFGEGCLAGQVSRNATATTLLDSQVVRIALPSMRSLLRSDPAFAQRFGIHLVRRVARIEEDLIDLQFNSTEKRLARALLLLASLDDESQLVLSGINQQMLAEIVGTTRPRISQFIGRFRKRGFVSGRLPLRVHSSLAQVMLEE